MKAHRPSKLGAVMHDSGGVHSSVISGTGLLGSLLSSMVLEAAGCRLVGHKTKGIKGNQGPRQRIHGKAANPVSNGMYYMNSSMVLYCYCHSFSMVRCSADAPNLPVSMNPSTMIHRSPSGPVGTRPERPKGHHPMIFCLPSALCRASS